MRNNPWFPLVACMLFGVGAYLVIVTVGCGGVNTAIDELVNQSEETPIRQDIDQGFGAIMNWRESTEEADVFTFPDDRGGQLLSQLLPPSEKAQTQLGDAAYSPRRLPPPSQLDNPSPPLPPAQLNMPRLPPAQPQSLRPRPLPEDIPLFHHKTEVPAPPYLATSDRVRLPSVDVNQPIPLPILAQPVTDRAPLDDATTDASLAAALAGSPPARTAPAPFLKLNLPDPFENRLKPPPDLPENVAPTHTGARPGR